MAKALPRLPYTVKEIAEHYGMSTEAVRKEIVTGRLRAAHKRGQSKVWYVKHEWLCDWAENMLEDI